MPYHFDPVEQEAAGERFGAMLRRWRQLNGWTQYTVHNWARQAGFEALAPSTLSVMENGKAFKPRPETFFALGEANRRLDERDFTGVTDRALLERLQRAEPICTPEGDAWGPAEFWSCHVGLLPIPPAYLPLQHSQTQVSEAQAAELSERLTVAFRESARRGGHGPIELLRLIVQPVPRKHRARFQAVASGLSVYTAHEVNELGGFEVLDDWIKRGLGSDY